MRGRTQVQSDLEMARKMQQAAYDNETQENKNKNKPSHNDYDPENYHGQDLEHDEEELREGVYAPNMTKKLSKRKSNKQGDLLEEYKPQTPSTIKWACWANIIFIGLILILLFLSI